VEEYPRRRLAQYQAERKANAKLPAANVLTTRWELTPEDVAQIEAQLGKGALDTNEIVIARGYDNVSRYDIALNEEAVVTHYLQRSNLPPSESEHLADAATLADFLEQAAEIEEPSQQLTELLAELKKVFPNDNPTTAAIKLASARLPRFVYFTNYEFMPGTVSLVALAARKAGNALELSDRIFLALLDLAGTSLEEIQAINRFEEFVAKLEGVSNFISEQIFAYWSQNKNLEVQFRLDEARPQDPPPNNTGHIFRTRIRNERHKVTVGFDERSTGFVWFFSFLVWFSQVRQNYGENLFILLDEPGLSLHARAQADLLRYMHEKLAPSYQLIYTTHSPFMIEPDNLEGVRTVEDVVLSDGTYKGTKVGDKIFSTDADTVFPIQAALGYDITQTLFVGKHSLLVEGSSDMLFLETFSRMLVSDGKPGLDSRWTITPVGGIDKVGTFVALFGANKIDVAVFTDIHEGAKRKVRDLRESKLLKDGRVFSAEMYTGSAEADIEDLIGWELYRELVHAAYNLRAEHQLPAARPAGQTRVVKAVEEHFRSLPPEIPEFDHMLPALAAVETQQKLGVSVGIEPALERSSALITDLNNALGSAGA
jgi:hypothetical protein